MSMRRPRGTTHLYGRRFLFTLFSIGS
jgi:hypothetical protein